MSVKVAPTLAWLRDLGVLMLGTTTVLFWSSSRRSSPGRGSVVVPRCHYRTRCVQRAAVCGDGPGLQPVASESDHLARCHFREI